VVKVWTRRPMPIGVTVVRSQTEMDLGPPDLVEKLVRQGFIETDSTRTARQNPIEPEKKHKKPVKSG